MRYGLLLLGLTLCAPIEAAAQAPGCQRPLATLTVPRAGYMELNVDAFEGRVFAYAPEAPASGGSGFQRFQLWIVEGVYGKPFMRGTGSLDQAGFEALRKNPNVRATAVAVARGDGSDTGQFRVGKNAYAVQVLKVAAGARSAVPIRICQ